MSLARQAVLFNGSNKSEGGGSDSGSAPGGGREPLWVNEPEATSARRTQPGLGGAPVCFVAFQ